MIRVLQLSDAHLSPRTGLFRRNFANVLAAVSPPDLCVATGDLSLDGADRDEDLAFAAAWHRRAPAPMIAIPGNHDTGSEARLMPKQPFDTARMERWRRHLGPERHMQDLPGWRVVALNSEAMGTGHAEEAVQAAFIRDAAAGAGERRIALFLHKPPFLHATDEAWNAWSVAPEGRAALRPLLEHPGLRLVASGHLHLHHQARRGRVSHVWAPATSFHCKPADQDGIPGSRAPGALMHTLREDHVETEAIAPGGLDVVLIDDVATETYGGG